MAYGIQENAYWANPSGPPSQPNAPYAYGNGPSSAEPSSGGDMGYAQAPPQQGPDAQQAGAQSQAQGQLLGQQNAQQLQQQQAQGQADASKNTSLIASLLQYVA